MCFGTMKSPIGCHYQNHRRRDSVARIVSLECDKCGLEIRNDMNRVTIWRHRLKFEKYDVRKLLGDNEEVYLCGNCAKEFRKWLKEG